jgi:lipoate-protein ligase A
MIFLDWTCETAWENVAADEWLLEMAEDRSREYLRIWEASSPFVVLGYANKVAEEVFLERCGDEQVPVIRRISGGGTVLEQRGCLNYALILRIQDELPTRSIPETNIYVMERQRRALQKLAQGDIRVEGHTDLAISGKKVSGNAQKRGRNFLLFHGSILLNANLDLITRFLKSPSRMPDYRAGRPHGEFVANLEIRADDVKSALINEWKAIAPMEGDSIQLPPNFGDKYRDPKWNLKF